MFREEYMRQNMFVSNADMNFKLFLLLIILSFLNILSRNIVEYFGHNDKNS